MRSILGTVYSPAQDADATDYDLMHLGRVCGLAAHRVLVVRDATCFGGMALSPIVLVLGAWISCMHSEPHTNASHHDHTIHISRFTAGMACM